MWQKPAQPSASVYRAPPRRRALCLLAIVPLVVCDAAARWAEPSRAKREPRCPAAAAGTNQRASRLLLHALSFSTLLSLLSIHFFCSCILFVSFSVSCSSSSFFDHHRYYQTTCVPRGPGNFLPVVILFRLLLVLTPSLVERLTRPWLIFPLLFSLTYLFTIALFFNSFFSLSFPSFFFSLPTALHPPATHGCPSRSYHLPTTLCIVIIFSIRFLHRFPLNATQRLINFRDANRW